MTGRKCKAWEPEDACNQYAGQRLAAFDTASLRFAVPAATYATAYKNRKTLPVRCLAKHRVLPSLEMNRDRSRDNLFMAGNIFKVS